MNAPFEGIGASVRRKEDLRFISGHGHYTDDINRPFQLHAYIKRSDRPHARIVSIDTAAAKASPGVAAVFTSADLGAVGGLPCGWQIHSKDGSAMIEPKHPMQEMFREHHALQCGFCTPGMVMSAIDLVAKHPQGLTEQEIRDGLEGNLCRCTGYHNIVKAIAAAWPLMQAKAAE